jgi:hypothetical protein
MNLSRSFITQYWIEMTPAFVELHPLAGMRRQVLEHGASRGGWTDGVSIGGDRHERHLRVSHGREIVDAVIAIDQCTASNGGGQLTKERAL